MSGLFSTLSIAKTGITAQQYGLSVTGHNVSNVDNPHFSRQNADHSSNQPAVYSGHLFGTGVNVQEIRRSVDTLLESRLTNERSTQSALAETELYLTEIEGYFDETSHSSLNSSLGVFWNSWHDLSTSPLGASQRVQVYEQGERLTQRFRDISGGLERVGEDIEDELESAVGLINSYAEQLANLNREIQTMEASHPANDLRDKQNQLINDMAELINVDVIQQGNGSLVVNVASGATLVSGTESNSLDVEDGRVIWKTSLEADITDDIVGGKMAGWLVIRDEVIPKYRNQLNELSKELIWNLNKINSQGVGQDYFTGSLTGSYAADDSGWLSSLPFGDRINYSNAFTMWVKDQSNASAEYHNIMFDMGISTASASDFQGTAPGGDAFQYRLTVLDGAEVGDKIVTQINGDRIGGIWGSTAGTAATALDDILGNQLLTIYGNTGTHKIDIRDQGGDAKRSMADIAEELNGVPGVSAHVSKTEVAFDLTGVTNAQDGDEIEYELYVDGIVHQQSFTRDSAEGTLEEQFESALVDAAKEINKLNGNSDLYADGLELISDRGATLGIQNFQVEDNAGVQLDTFTNFNTSDTVTLTVASDGIPTTSIGVEVDLTGIMDINDQAEVAAVFEDALSQALVDEPFEVSLDTINNAVIVRTTNGANLTLRDSGGDTGGDATINLTALSGTSTSGVGNTSLLFDGSGDVETFNSDTLHTDAIGFTMPGSITTSVAGTSSVVLENTSTAAGANTAAVITSTLTVLMEPGMSMASDMASSQGLFGSGGTAVTGGSIMTFGGEDGFENFSAGDVISFDLDGQNISFTVSSVAGGTTEAGLAQQLFDELNSDITDEGYTIIRNGKSVSVIKAADSDDPISISNFSDSGGSDARLHISTGTGEGTHDPENNILDAGLDSRNFAVSSLYDDTGQILWERLDMDGNTTGSHGLVTVDADGEVVINEGGVQTLSFDLGRGSLVAGNTLTVNTDDEGSPDPLQMKVFREANSVNDTYSFKVISGGKIGYPSEDDEPLIIEWSSDVAQGRFEIQPNDPPKDPNVPVEVEVDGMLLSFTQGTLAEGERFTITTDESGLAVSKDAQGHGTAETQSDWHWTQDSFADRLNRIAPGVRARVTHDNHMVFEASDYYSVENVEYSGSEGFSSDNAQIIVNDYGALDFEARDFQFVRSGGSWGILNDPTGGQAKIIPEGGDDNGFMVDFNGDQIGDVEIKFSKAVTGDGWARFDLIKHDAEDMGFAFGDDASEGSDVLAAMGVNTFFIGDGARDMAMNTVLEDTRFVAAGKIDSRTGEIHQGDNQNALAMAKLQTESLTMKQWNFTRGKEATSSLIDSSIDDYYGTLIGSIGVTSKNVKNARSYSDVMVDKMTEQRNSVSAVSLDEEMIKLLKYQHAYSAASKLLSTTDEMLNTLIAIR